MAHRSAKTKAKYDDGRIPLLRRLFAERPYCQIGAPGCTRLSTVGHERRKRSSGGSIVNPVNVMAVCASCNSWVEDHPVEAHDAGAVVREGDREWESLAAGRDRHG